ncbi:MAG: thiolase family protein [Syntrophomonadaceae bacterium]|nr:thiolase family protein [Syntrophomonadaceae bacterium]
MKLNEVVMVSGCRTPIGKFLGQFKDVPAKDLAVIAGKEAIKRAGIPADIIDEIVMGEVYQGMQKSLPARIVGLACGLPERSNACVVNQNCTSGMRALEIASRNIMVGATDIALVVGVENMTRAPYMVPSGRSGARMGDTNMIDSLTHDALVDSLVPGHMGMTAENVAVMYNITREQCDQLAVRSHQNAINATDAGIFKREIVPVEVKTRKGVTIVDTDEHPIRGCSMESIGKLKPAFKKDGGVVTAANASGINDGASAAVIMSKQKAEELGIKPLMKLTATVGVGVDPQIMGIGPAEAIPVALEKAGWQFDDVDYWELHEAFAPQFIGCKIRLKEKYGLDLSMDKVNHNGSGIALGHPIGSSGLRIVISLYYEMERLGLTKGCASTCVGTGPAMASLWTREI